MLRILVLVLICAAAPDMLSAQTAEAPQALSPPMNVDRLGAILTAIDPATVVEARGMTLTVAAVPVTVVVDPNANRMRILVPIASVEGLGEAELLRLMQANFDSALDARYAIANELLWAAYIHPLSPLQKDQLISGIGQVVNLAQSFGTLYSSGGLLYGGGDSGALQRALIDELLKKGKEI